MGAYSGLITFAVAFWYLQTVSNLNETAADENKKNGWKWFWIGGGIYFGGFILGMFVNRLFVSAIGGIDVGIGTEFGEATGGDTGALGITLELIPIIVGVAAAYVVRRVWLLNQKFDFSALMSRFSAKR
jgi:hypothetical protein